MIRMRSGPRLFRLAIFYWTRNHNGAFVEGSKSLRTSTFKDHTASAMHKKAMILFKQQQGVDLVKYSPIPNAL